MRLTLPVSSSQLQALLSAAEPSRLSAVREQTGSDGNVSLSAKHTDSFNFVDHPRLTVSAARGILLDYRCDCVDFRRTKRLCPHCIALAAARFPELSPEPMPGELPPLSEPVQPEPEEAPQPPEISRISYAFCNCAQHLYPGKAHPRIPLVRYQQIYGKNAMARTLYARNTRWGGSCYGMTATATMFYLPQDPITITDFKEDARIPAELQLTSRSRELGMTLHAFIECVHVLQFHSSLAYQRHSLLQNPSCLDLLCSRVKHFQETWEDPVSMGIWRSPKFDGGHAVFPYWLETSEDGCDRLHIYDPNHPMEARFAYLEKDPQGHYTNWRFPMNSKNEYSSADGAQLCFDSYSVYKQAWDRRADGQPDAMLCADGAMSILDSYGALLARISDDGVESYRDSIFQVPVLDSFGSDGSGVMLYMPAGIYRLRSDDAEQGGLSAQFTHTEQALTIRTAAREAEVLADDLNGIVSVRITQADCAYCIEFDVPGDDDAQLIRLEGITAEGGLLFACEKGRLYACGILPEETSVLYIDEELSDLSCIERNTPPLFIRNAEAKPIRQIVTSQEADPTGDETAE